MSLKKGTRKLGLIDITDILADPDLVDPMSIVRRTPCVDSFGENKLTEQSFQTYGSIQSVSGKTLLRLPEAFRVMNVMSFWVKGQIISDGKNRYPDLLIFRGSRFAVQMVFDWTNWGDGWCEGTCVREVPAL